MLALLVAAALGDLSDAPTFKSYVENSRRRKEDAPAVAATPSAKTVRLTPAAPRAARGGGTIPPAAVREWKLEKPAPAQHGFLLVGALTLLACAAAVAPILARPDAPPPLRRPEAPPLLPPPEPRRTFVYVEDQPWRPPPEPDLRPSWRAVTAREQSLIEAWAARADRPLADWLRERGERALLAKLDLS